MDRRRWQATTLDYTALLDYDNDVEQSICLTQRQAAILKALLTNAYHATRWENLAISAVELGFIVAEIDCRLDGGCTMFLLRQNEADPCLLEQSEDGGVTWTTAFNYKLCQNTDTIALAETWNVSNEFNIDQSETYDGDIVNIYPTWVYDSSPEDADRDAALCAAITAWVDSLCDFMIVSIENGNVDVHDQSQFWSDIAFGLGAVATGLGVFGLFPVAALFGGTSLLLTSVILANMDDWLTESTAAYEDLDARATVVCVMYAALAGLTPTYSDWSGALLGELGGNAEIIREVIHDCNQEEMAFVNFLGLYVDMIDLGVAQTGNECAECTDFSHLWKFDTLSGELAHTTYNNDSPQWDILKGAYVGESGMEAEDDTGPPDRRMTQLEIEWDASRTLTKVGVFYAWEQGQIEDWGDVGCKILVDGVAKGTWTLAQVQGNTYMDWTGSIAGCTSIEVRLYCAWNTPPPASTWGGEATIRSITVEGIGTCPFE